MTTPALANVDGDLTADEDRNLFIASHLRALWPDQQFTITSLPGGDIGVAWTDGPPAGAVAQVAERAASDLLGPPPAWPQWIQPHRATSVLANVLALVDTWRNGGITVHGTVPMILWSVLPDDVNVHDVTPQQVSFCRAVCNAAGHTGDLRASAGPDLRTLRRSIATALHTSGRTIVEDLSVPA